MAAATAVRVFGNPITQGTRAQRAQAAQNYQNADGKLDQVLQLSSQSQNAAAGNNQAPDCSTFGMIYNATGDTVTKVTTHDWEGNVVWQHPVHIQNGQWAVFMHAGTSDPRNQGSIAAVVYNIQHGTDAMKCTDAMIAWNNPWKTGLGGKNTAYCEMNVPGYFNTCDWDAIYKKLKDSGVQSQARMEGYGTNVSIDGEGNTPSFNAIFCLAHKITNTMPVVTIRLLLEPL
ncbi:23 kDa jasmonate-induced protein-like [Bidens hawaiensis]|uniref:23 kDa jasmonate-induced protein-like n=1 Tax=Bidens hawaiensis TaxID=980011 RepID=UPI00404B7290